jgi:tetratricopeptide (TPR) repeat protein
LRDLHRAILRGDPDLEGQPATASAEPAPPPARAAPAPVPAQLPADVPGFTGRAEQLAALTALLPPVGGPEPAGVVCVIDGMPGVGKTALVARWAREARRHFPDGQLYLDLHGYSDLPPLRPGEALPRLLASLRVPAGEIPVDLAATAALFRSLLADRRVLLVLDNARAADQVRPLLPGRGPALVLVTGRERLTGLIARDGARRLPLGPLPSGESVQLLGRLLGPDRVTAEPAATAELARVCAHLPLALRIAAANLVAGPPIPLARYVRRLRGRHRLAGLELANDPGASVRQAFTLSYLALPASERRLFRLLGLVPGPEIDVEAAAALADRPVSAVRAELAGLARRHLLTEVGERRYQQHDLVRRHAHDLAEQEEPATDRTAAVHRLLTHYLRYARAATAVAFPGTVQLPSVVPGPTVRFAGPAESLGWLDAHLPALVAAVQAAASRGSAELAWQLADALAGYFRSGRHPAGWLTTAQAALMAARSEGDPAARVAAHHNLGIAHRSVARYPVAVAHLTAAVAGSRQLGDLEREWAAVGALATVLADTGQPDRATALLHRAVELSRRLGDRRRQASQLSQLGAIRLLRGDLAGAGTACAAALALYRDCGNPLGAARARSNLGWVGFFQGLPGQARRQFAAALTEQRRHGDRHGEAVTSAGLAELAVSTGRPGEALEWATASLELARAGRDRRTEIMARVALSRAALGAGDARQAAADAGQAARLAQRAGIQCLLSEALLVLAEIQPALGRPDRAGGYVRRALAVARRGGYRLMEDAALTVLAELPPSQPPPAAS